MAGRGFFPVRNDLMAEACRRPAAAAVYMALAATDLVWTARDGLEAYQVRASRADLVTKTGVTPDKVRGALAWLIRRGFLERLDTSRTAAAVFRFVLEPPKQSTGASSTPATTSRPGNGTESPSLPKNPQKTPQVVPKPKPKADKGLQGSPQPETPKKIPQVLKDVEDKDNNPTRRLPVSRASDARGGSASHGGNSLASDWARVHAEAGRHPPDDPGAKHPDRYRETILRKLIRSDRDPASERARLRKLMGLYCRKHPNGGVLAFAEWAEGLPTASPVASPPGFTEWMRMRT